MRGSLFSFMALSISIGIIPSTNTWADDGELVGKIGRWTISYTLEGRRGCFASADFPDKTTLSIMKLGSEGEWEFFLRNDDWRSIRGGHVYSIEFLLDADKLWENVSVGSQNNGLMTSLTDPDFIVAFSQSELLTVQYRNTLLGRFDLSDSSKVISAIEKCHSDNFQQEIMSDIRYDDTESNENRLLSKQYAQCMDRAGGVTSSMRECYHEEYTRQDRILNERYKSRISSSSDEQKIKLKSAQRAWIEFRDANCAFFAAEEGGTLGQLISDSCILEMTAARAFELTK